MGLMRRVFANWEPVACRLIRNTNLFRSRSTSVTDYRGTQSQDKLVNPFLGELSPYEIAQQLLIALYLTVQFWDGRVAELCPRTACLNTRYGGQLTQG